MTPIENFWVKGGGKSSEAPWISTQSWVHDGMAGHISATYTSDFALGTKGAIEMWIKPATVAGNDDFIACFSGTAPYPGFLVQRLGATVNFFKSDGVAFDQSTTGSILTAGQWDHLLVTYDSSLGEVDIVLNGGTPTSFTGKTRSIGASMHDLFVGLDTNISPSRYYYGKMKNLAVYKGVGFDSSDIAESYNSGAPFDLRTHSQYASTVLLYDGEPPTTASNFPDLSAVGTNDGTGHTMSLDSDVP